MEAMGTRRGGFQIWGLGLQQAYDATEEDTLWDAVTGLSISNPKSEI